MEKYSHTYPQFYISYTSYTICTSTGNFHGLACVILGGVLMSKYGPAFRLLIPCVDCIFRLMKPPSSPSQRGPMQSYWYMVRMHSINIVVAVLVNSLSKQ